MARPFKYDISTLIELIKIRSCIWDKYHESFKDRTEKQKAWDEICVALEKDYFRKDKKEQRRICDLITGKWQNIRDAFVKSLKKQSVHPTVRKYLYHQKLQFLLKVLHRDDEESYLHITSEESQAEKAEEPEVERSEKSYSSRKKPRLDEDINQEILKALRHTKTAPDEDEAFFISITPTVRKMSEENKLEFRMGVLQLIKDISSRGKDHPDSAFFSGNSACSSSHPSNTFHHYPDPNAESEDYGEETHLFKCE